MDGAWLGSIDISIKKARTARFFDMNTGDIGAVSQPGGSLRGLQWRVDHLPRRHSAAERERGGCRCHRGER
jgi:uncharacterized protein GlcG (DUF336 family)